MTPNRMTVDALRVGRPGRAQLAVDCPFCGDTHYHGAIGPSIGAGAGPRLSHCLDRPRRDYALREVPPWHAYGWRLDVVAENKAATR